MTGHSPIPARIILMPAGRRFALWMLLAAACFAVSGRPVDAQDFRQYREYDRYRYLPRLPEGPEVPSPLTFDEAPLTGDPKVLVDELKGVILLDNPEAVVETPEGEGVIVRGSSGLINSPGVRAIASSYLGGAVSIRRLNELVREVIRFYRNNDQPVVNVTVPPGQDITDGVVQIVVIEGRVGRVIVDGPCYFDPQVLVDQVWICPGEFISEYALEEETRWLIRNPFRRVELELTPGDNPYETDLIFNIQDKRPVRLYAGYEDTGQRANGLERTFYGINWFNAFQKDDQFGYQYTASSDFHRVGAHSAFYSKALQNRDILTLYTSYVDFAAPIPGFVLANEGRIWQTLLRWYRELEPIGCYEHGITAGFDFKRIDTRLEFGGAQVLTFSKADIAQFMIGYNGKRFDPYGSFHVGVDAYLSPGNLSGLNKSLDFETIRPDASASYAYVRGFFERQTDLHDGWEAMGRITGQLSEGNLLPTEQLGFGGYNSIRGFDMYSVTADSGYFVNLELRTPVIQLGVGEHYGIGDEFGISQDQLRFHVFYDVGDAYDHTLFTGQDPSVDLQSTGVGFRYNLDRRFSLRADYAWQISQLATQPSPRERWHIGAVVSY